MRTAPPHDRRLTGRVEALTPDTLALRTDGKVRRLGLGEIRTLELPTEKTEHLSGALVGLITGGLLGAALGSAIETGSTRGLGGAMNGLMLGAPIGLAAGYVFLGHEEWVGVPLERLRVGLGPGRLRLEIPLGR